MHENRSETTQICPTCKSIFHPWKTRNGTQIYCKSSCARRTKEFKDNLSIKMAGRIAGHRGKKLPHRSGANCHFWKGGVAQINRTERQNFSRTTEYRTFREKVLKRDNYKCVVCGDYSCKGRGKHCKLFVDHIKPYLLFPELRLREDNARTLCNKCNVKTNTYGSKVLRLTREDFD